MYVTVIHLQPCVIFEDKAGAYLQSVSVIVSHFHPSLIFEEKTGTVFTTLYFLCNQGILTEGGRLSTVDLLIKVACIIKNVNNIFNIKRS